MPRGRQISKNANKNCTKLTNAEMAEQFFIHIEAKGLAASTIKTYKDYVRQLLEFSNNETIDEMMIDKFIVCKKSSYHANGLRTVMIHLRSFLNFCFERKYLEPFTVVVPKAEQSLKEPYSEDEIKRLTRMPLNNNWTEWRNWAFVCYCLGTGQRLSTVVNIKLEDLDFSNNTVFLRHNKDKIQKRMPLSSATAKMLQKYIKVCGITYDDEYLFIGYEGKQINKNTITSAVKRYCLSRGVEKHSIHLFRHTFAREYIVNGGNPFKLQQLLNHKTLDMTLKYVRLYSSDIAEGLDNFNPLDRAES